LAVSVKQLLRRRGALVAGITSLALGAFLVVQSALFALISFLAYSPANGGLQGPQFSPLSSVLYDAVITTLPFVVGFFLSLWLVGPISEELHLQHVITRSVLAAGIGCTLIFVVHSVVYILRAVTYSGAIFGNSFPTPGLDPGSIPAVLGQSLAGALGYLLTLIPLGVLAGILLWEWRKDHPSRFHVEGIIDV